MSLNAENLKSLSLRQLALEASNDPAYQKSRKALYAAEPYLQAMCQLDSINDRYFCDSGKSVVLYFLCNARAWKGDVARLVKAELNRRVKS